jgi:molybdate transport system regulatory protein
MRDRFLLFDNLKLGPRLDTRFFALLAAIESTGSLRRAAQAAGYSYRGAWLLMEGAARWVSRPLIETTAGGRGIGGTRLTDDARALLRAYHELQRRLDDFLDRQESWLLDQPEIARLLRRYAMKTTARNQFAGTLTEVHAGPVTAQATITTPGGFEITATMTAAAAQKLKLKAGLEAIALVKASAVVLVTDFAGYTLSARNQLAGTISRVEKGAVSSLVGVTLPGGAVITASVTNDAVEGLALAVGQPATAVFKAYSVMLATAA